MSAANQPFDLETFLASEERQATKHEFDGFAVQAMVGVTVAHSIIQGNLSALMVTRLRGKPCRFHGTDLKIQLAGSIRYPNGFVVCSPLPADARIVTDPVVIFEILSESTARTDVGAKNREDEATASVQRYVILEQAAVAGMQFERLNGDWISYILRHGSHLQTPEIGIDLMLPELYQGLDLKNPAFEGSSV